MNKIEKTLIRQALPLYINGKDDLKALFAVMKAMGWKDKGLDILVAINAISDICRPFNILRKELELELEKIQTED